MGTYVNLHKVTHFHMLCIASKKNFLMLIMILYLTKNFIIIIKVSDVLLSIKLMTKTIFS
jgi:hypothetical protein